MKKTTIIVLFSFLACSSINAQTNENKTADETEFTPSGSAFGKVFWNYHYDFNDNPKSSFELQRVYLGYTYDISKAISAKITLDGVKKSDASEYTAFVKIAQLDWKIISNIKLSVGLIGLQQFNDQEKFWGYRYIYKSFQDEFALGTSADLGANVELKPVDFVKINIFMLNGDGYTSLQDDYGMHKYGADVLFEPVKGLLLKGYYSANFNKFDLYGNDSIIVDTSTIHNLAFFAGYKNKKFRVGGEFNMMLNGTKYNSSAEDHNLLGVTMYATYIINKKFEIFGNYIRLYSNKLQNETDPWNYGKDGNLILLGTQYAPVKGVKLALNYRTYLFDNSDIKDLSRIYLNFEFSF
ncbi:MAG: hypothetical protein JW894_15795 [Bacteroidales bacterium]|nr:hypothetical protein [Bacteroidales bacterium]